MKFPDRARRAVAFLFRAYNDIDIYVEDSSSRNAYVILVNRILNGRARVNRVFQLGDRAQVLAACSADQSPSRRGRLYIIDGDFDYVHDLDPPALQHLYRLEVYTSENLFFSREAAVEVAFESLPNEDRAKVEELLDFESFTAHVIDLLTPLFIVYTVANRLADDIVTTGCNVHQFCDQAGGRPVLSEEKITAKRDEILADLNRRVSEGLFSDAVLQTTLAIATERFDVSVDERAKLISGKSYLMPLLYHHLKARAQFAGMTEQLKVRLARYTNLDIDFGLWDAILSAAS